MVPGTGSGSFPNWPKLICVELPDKYPLECDFISITYIVLGFKYYCSSLPKAVLYISVIKVKQ